jgi:adenine-specific DNA glycosylase
MQKVFGLKVVVEKRLTTVTHTFTRFKAHLYPFLCKAKRLQPVAGYEWVLKESLSDLPFSSGHRRIIDL